MNSKRERGSVPRGGMDAGSATTPLDSNLREFADPRFYARREDLRKEMIQRVARIDQEHLTRGTFNSSGRLSYRLEARVNYLRRVLEARVQATVEGYETAGAAMDKGGFESLNATLRTIVEAEKAEFIKESTRDADMSGLGFDLLRSFHTAIARDCGNELARSIGLARSEKARLELKRIRSADETTQKPSPKLPPAVRAADATPEPAVTTRPVGSLIDHAGAAAHPMINEEVAGLPQSLDASQPAALEGFTRGESDRGNADWQRIEPSGVPLVGWKAIAAELRIAHTRSNCRHLKQWNDRFKGPIVYMHNRPTVDAARLKVWVSQLSNSGAAAEEREAGRARSISELSKRDHIGLSDLGMHSTRRRDAPKPKTC